MAVDKSKIMEETLNNIKEKMPSEVIGKFKDIGKDVEVDTISTGSIAIDSVIGGGFPKGRLVQIVGKASSGKTTLCLTAIAELQKTKPDANILYVDAENALDPSYARQLGVNMDELYFIQPSNGEQGYEAASMFIDSGIADLVVIDSLPALIPAAMMDYELGEAPKIAMGATLDGKGVSRLMQGASKTKAVVLIINQYRERVVVGMPTQGDGVSGNGYLPGGQTIPFYMSQILKIQRVAKQESGNEFTADQIRMTAIKNKIAPPYRTTDFFIAYGKGVDVAQEIIELGHKYDLIFRTARTYAVIDQEKTKAAREENPEADVVIVDGSRQTSRQKFVDYLNDNKELMESLKQEISELLRKEKLEAGADPEAIKEEELMKKEME